MTWRKPRDKYKEFSYRAFAKWKIEREKEDMKEVYAGNGTSCDYLLQFGIPSDLKFYVMAYVVREIPLIPVVGMYVIVYVSSLDCEIPGYHNSFANLFQLFKPQW